MYWIRKRVGVGGIQHWILCIHRKRICSGFLINKTTCHFPIGQYITFEFFLGPVAVTIVWDRSELIEDCLLGSFHNDGLWSCSRDGTCEICCIWTGFLLTGAEKRARESRPVEVFLFSLSIEIKFYPVIILPFVTERKPFSTCFDNALCFCGTGALYVFGVGDTDSCSRFASCSFQ